MVFFIKKFILFALIFAFVLPCFCFSSSAEDLSWKDYIKEVDVEAGTVTVSLPATPSTFVVSPSGLQDQFFNYVDYMLYTFESYEETGREYSLQISPNPSDHLFLGNVPDGTHINLYLDIRSVAYPEGDTVNGLPVVPVWNFSVDRYNANLFYYDEAGEVLRVESMDFGELSWAGDDPDGSSAVSSFMVVHDLHDPLGNFDTGEYFQSAHSMRTTYFFEGMRFSSTEEVKISVSSFEIVFYMDSLISSDGEYSEILEVILASLARYGKTIDLLTGEIIEKADPILPINWDAVKEFFDFGKTNIEKPLEDAFDESLVFTDSATQNLSFLGGSLLLVSNLMNSFLDLPFFSAVISFSLSLGIFAFAINVIISIVSKSRG